VRANTSFAEGRGAPPRKLLPAPLRHTVVDAIGGDARRAAVANGDAGEAVAKYIVVAQRPFRAVDE
jgi:hypothetical protein